MEAALSQWTDLADRAYAADSKDLATRMWQSAATASEALPPDSRTRSDLQARIVLDTLRRGETGTAIEKAVLVTDPDARDRTIALLVSDPSDACWTIRDGLRRIAGRHRDGLENQAAGLMASLDIELS